MLCNILHFFVLLSVLFLKIGCLGYAWHEIIVQHIAMLIFFAAS